MTIKKLIEANKFQLLNQGSKSEEKIESVYTCDLLSIAMSKIPDQAAWVTVMGNINTLAVANLTEASCIILAEGVNLDDTALNKAKEQGITVFKTDLPVFEAALYVHQHLND